MIECGSEEGEEGEEEEEDPLDILCTILLSRSPTDSCLVNHPLQALDIPSKSRHNMEISSER